MHSQHCVHYSVKRIDKHEGARHAGFGAPCITKPCVPSRQSRHISSFNVYTLILYGSQSSTSTLRFCRYFFSILYGCLAPLVRSSIITSTGPFVLSGFAAGVSVDGPIASVSARFNVVGGSAHLVGGVGPPSDGSSCASSEPLGGRTFGVNVAIGAEAVVSEAVFVDSWAAPDAWSVRISTGLDDNASLLLCGRDPEPAGRGALCGAAEGWSAVDAMVDSQCKAAIERLGATKRTGGDWLQRACSQVNGDGVAGVAAKNRLVEGCLGVSCVGDGRSADRDDWEVSPPCSPCSFSAIRKRGKNDPLSPLSARAAWVENTATATSCESLLGQT
jgi:hypothetical protein